MFRIYEKQVFKNGQLIAVHSLKIICSSIEQIEYERKKANDRYKHAPGNYLVTLRYRPVTDECIKDYGVQLNLF